MKFFSLIVLLVVLLDKGFCSQENDHNLSEIELNSETDDIVADIEQEVAEAVNKEVSDEEDEDEPR